VKGAAGSEGTVQKGRLKGRPRIFWEGEILKKKKTRYQKVGGRERAAGSRIEKEIYSSDQRWTMVGVVVCL